MPQSQPAVQYRPEGGGEPHTIIGFKDDEAAQEWIDRLSHDHDLDPDRFSIYALPLSEAVPVVY